MNFIVDNWMLIGIAFLSGLMLLWPHVQGASQAGALTPPAAVQMMNRNKAIVVEVGEAEEFAGGHIIGSRHVPVGNIDEQLPGVIKNKATPLILVCPSGARAQRALGAARKLGYENVQVLAGGLKAWRDAGLPLEKA